MFVTLFFLLPLHSSHANWEECAWTRLSDVVQHRVLRTSSFATKLLNLCFNQNLHCPALSSSVFRFPHCDAFAKQLSLSFLFEKLLKIKEFDPFFSGTYFGSSFDQENRRREPEPMAIISQCAV
jgi:hypothetical protein